MEHPLSITAVSCAKKLFMENNKNHILIVDDDAYLRATLRQQLLVEGFSNVFEVGVVADLDNALSHANPDLILLDIQMPDGNGIDICNCWCSFSRR